MCRRTKSAVLISDLYCVECGTKGIPIPRTSNSCREAGHLKKLYCLHCGKETNHCEIKPLGHYTYTDFKQEFELGRFVNDKRVPLDKLQRCQRTCNYNINGRCWNANNSAHCEYKKGK